jgi:hypothetical protein
MIERNKTQPSGMIRVQGPAGIVACDICKRPVAMKAEVAAVGRSLGGLVICPSCTFAWVARGSA